MFIGVRQFSAGHSNRQGPTSVPLSTREPREPRQTRQESSSHHHQVRACTHTHTHTHTHTYSSRHTHSSTHRSYLPLSPCLSLSLFLPPSLSLPVFLPPSLSLSLSLFLSLTLPLSLSPTPPGWFTQALVRLLLSMSQTCRSGCALGLRRAWRPTCSGWTHPRSSPPGPICWWTAAIALPNLFRRLPQVCVPTCVSV